MWNIVNFMHWSNRAKDFRWYCYIGMNASKTDDITFQQKLTLYNSWNELN